MVGGGLAATAAAVALCQRGFAVELFEAQKQLGGRAGSFRDPRTGQLVDHCQHVAMGCCTNLADFCRRVGIADCFRRHRQFHFFAPDGTRHDFSSSRWLPAPLHLGPALMRLRYLSLGERGGIARAMGRLVRVPVDLDKGHRDETIGAWLRRDGQSDRAIQRFWSVVLASALSETVDRASLAAARQVFVDGFLASRRAYRLEVPNLPLGEMFGRRTAVWLQQRGVAVRLGRKVEQIDGDASRATAVVLPDGTRHRFDFVVVAVPWRHVRPLLPEAMLGAMPALDGVEHIRPAPITAVHLWFDRPFTPLPHAVLVGKLSQWVFHHGRQRLSPESTEMSGACEPSESAHYYQVVISASHELVGRDRSDIQAEVRRELQAVWPDAREARLLHWRVVTQPAAVFSVRPGIERFRPTQSTTIENLFLAGDWTATGWPATMEGAVRSGYLAAEAVLKRCGEADRVLVADLRRGWLARWL